jgi:phosphoserine aminotransferase
VASSEDKNFSYIPKGFEIPADLDYLYICANNTIYGTEYKCDLDSPVPLIADMSSNILSRPIDVSKYAMIYGGAQKNLAPAGVTFVIIRDDMLEQVKRKLPSMMNVNTHVENGSMFNTPPVFPIYVLSQTLRWLKAEGGVAAIHERNERKAAMLYAEIDRNPLFKGTAAVEDRSSMNICFVMNDGYEALADEFFAMAKERGMVGIKGHRLVGGFRASCYNACPVEAVEALVKCMQDFEKMHA